MKQGYIPTVSISLTPEEIQEFQEITFKLYKRKLSYDEAEDQLSRMVELAKLVIDTEDIFDTDDDIENAQAKEQNV